MRLAFRLLAPLLAAGLASGAAACARVPQPGAWGRPAGLGAPLRAATRGETWTLLVHLAADNDLYDFGLGDLQEMEAGLPRDGSLEVLVLFDGAEDGDSAVYRIRRDPAGYNDTIVSDKVAVPGLIPPSGEIDSGDRATVQRFLEWGARQARGERLMLTFWDHGSGLFRGASAGFLPLGFGYDDSGSHLTTADLSVLCATVKAVRGRPADIVGFDACLMGHGELAYQIAGLGGLFIASEHLIPGTGWDYEGWFARWERLTSRAPLAVSNALVDAFAASYALDRKDVTLSVVDVATFNNQVVPALDAFVAAAVRALPEHKKSLQRARARAKRFYNRDCADLGSFLANVERMVPVPEVRQAAGETRAALARAVLREHHTRPMFEGATGAVLYFPEPGQRYNADYDKPERVRFAERSWGHFLKAYR